MVRAWRWMFVLVLVLSMVMQVAGVAEGEASDGICDPNTSFGNISGSHDTARVSGGRAIRCGNSAESTSLLPSAYYSYEIICNTARSASSDAVCSTTPCANSGKFFAFRTIHYPDGTVKPAGYSCVTQQQASANAGLSLAQVISAIRQVKLPGGAIGVSPGRGLANLESYFWLTGAVQPPVNLRIGGSTVHAAFQVVEYDWNFGDGSTLQTSGPGVPGQGSEVHATYTAYGNYLVSVRVVWSAQAFLNGSSVGQVGGLFSSASTTYGVAELRTVLTG